MKLIKNTLVIALALFATSSFAQNCGYVSTFERTITDNGNGTSTYSFQVTVGTTSGGTKSSQITIKSNNHTFISNECIKTGQSPITYNYGPYTITTLETEPFVVWEGYTTDKCNGTTCISSTVTLPVELIKFEGIFFDNQATLSWTTASEINNEGFEIEKSIDGSNWETVGFEAGNGNSNQVIDYNYTTAQNEKTAYYRLKQLDYDGQFEYSKVIKVVKQTNEVTTISVYPNPCKDFIQVVGEFTSAKIVDLSGNEVMKFDNSNNTLNTSELTAGIYIIEIVSDYGVSQIKIMK